MSRIKKVEGKDITIGIKTLKSYTLNAKGMMEAIEDPVKKVLIDDAGRDRVIWYGDYREHFDVCVYNRFDSKPKVSNSPSMVEQEMLDDYIANRDTINWEDWNNENVQCEDN